MKRIVTLSLLFVVFATGLAMAQASDRIYHLNPNKVKVFGFKGEQSMPWCGGLNNPQFAMADLNRDGKNDLVILERYSTLRTFINISTTSEPLFRYEPAYESNFPFVKNYHKLLDYNLDNIPDLWHYGNSGLDVCDGYYNANNELSFKNCREIRYGKDWNIGINPSDMPDMADVDGDGDIDVITYSQWGSLIDWYKNLKTEHGLSNNALEFDLVDKCWGRMIQHEDKRPRGLQFTCGSKPADGAQNKTTGGSHGICLIDMDGDGDYDLLDGSYSLSDVQYLENGRADYGARVDTMISQDTMWQSNGTRVDVKNFAIGYWVDINDDGAKDLLFSPLMPDFENYRTVTYYKNAGNNSNPSFVYQTDTLFMDHVIDVGSRAYPILYDYDKDGKEDLLVGSAGYFQETTGLLKSRMSYYKNTSINGTVSFALQTTDFLNLGAEGFVGCAPAIGDIDGDGKDDLLIGRTDGTIRFYRNMALTNNDTPDWRQTPENLKAGSSYINVGGNAAPLIYDFDMDGHKDLIIGNAFGKLVYYKNLGTGAPGKPALSHITDSLGEVSVVAPYQVYGHSVPFIGKIDNTGNEYLLVGNNNGIISRYAFTHGDVKTPFTRLDSIYSDLDIPQDYVAPIVSDLDGDGKYEMIVGTELGGLLMYEQMFNVHVDELAGRRNALKLYPNPAKNELSISVANSNMTNEAVVTVYNGMGQSLRTNTIAVDQNQIRLDISMLPQGIFLCSVAINGEVHTATFIKQ